MAIIDEFGYKIYRLRECKTDNEYLIYDIKRKLFNQYSKLRAISVIEEEFKSRNIDLVAFLDRVGLQNEKPNQILKEWFLQETILIDNISYQPVDELLFEDNNKTYFNIYKKSDLLKKECKNKEFNNIHNILMNLVGNDERSYNWFCSWLAWQIKNPLKRLPTGIIFQGEQGTGKSVFCNFVLKNIFDHNYREIGQAQINQDFNDFMLGKQIIVANEVIHNDNKFLIPDKLKNYMTDEFVDVNKKFKDPITAKNYTQWIYLSNNQIPVKLDKDDRRYTVVQSKKLQQGFEIVTDLLNNLDNELEGFIYYLKSLNPEYSYLATPLDNKARKDLIKAGGNSIDNFINTILDDFEGIFEQLDNYYTGLDLEVYTDDDTKQKYLSTNQLYKIYQRFVVEEGFKHPTSKNVFTRNLQKYGIEATVKRINGYVVRVYIYDQMEFIKQK